MAKKEEAFEVEGISVPDQVSILSVGGLPVSEWVRPRLSTFKQDSLTIGKEAGNMLYEIMNEDPKKQSVRHILLKPELVEGDSILDLS